MSKIKKRTLPSKSGWSAKGLASRSASSGRFVLKNSKKSTAGSASTIEVSKAGRSVQAATGGRDLAGRVAVATTERQNSDTPEIWLAIDYVLDSLDKAAATAEVATAEIAAKNSEIAEAARRIDRAQDENRRRLEALASAYGG